MSKYIEHPFAVIYPVPFNLASRIFDEKKSVFVKYAPRESIPKRLVYCKKIIIYESQSNKEITGECDILSLDLMELSKVISEYKDDLFLNEDELRAYSSGRGDKKILVFKLNNIIKYSLPKTLNHTLTMAGEYISAELYDQLISRD